MCGTSFVVYILSGFSLFFVVSGGGGRVLTPENFVSFKGVVAYFPKTFLTVQYLNPSFGGGTPPLAPKTVF